MFKFPQMPQNNNIYKDYKNKSSALNRFYSNTLYEEKILVSFPSKMS